MAKAATEIRSLARSHTDAAIRTLAAIMKQKKAPPAARINAACALLDRGWGKPDKIITAEVGASDVFIEGLKRVSAGEFSKGPAKVIE